ncbi:MAG: hypothetical protein U0795_24185 [Pirellulales bacterium]
MWAIVGCLAYVLLAIVLYRALNGSRGLLWRQVGLLAGVALVVGTWFVPFGWRGRPASSSALERPQAVVDRLGVGLFRVASLSTSTASMSLVSSPTLSPRDATASLSGSSPVERVVAPASYVGAQACQSCHPGEYDSWYASYHRRMTQVAGPEAVTGPFDGRFLRAGDTQIQLLQDGRSFITRWQRSGVSRSETRKVVMTTGSHHLQLYWLATSKPRVLDKLPFAYLVSEQRWVPVDSTFLHPPGLVSSHDSGQWNTNCLFCHATGSNPGFSADNQQPATWDRVQGLETHVADFGIACEACHGPGSDHCDQYRNPLHRYASHLLESGGSSSSRPKVDHRIVQPLSLDPTRASHVCGQCHSVHFPRTDAGFQQALRHGFAFRPGQHFEQGAESDRVFADPLHPDPVLQRMSIDDPGYVASMFWSDGVVRVTGREFNGLARSPCFNHGGAAEQTMTCLSCHQLHHSPADPRARQDWTNDQLKPEALGNQACLQCHEQYGSDVELQRHTHHAASSSGSVCYNCHMPHTTFGLLGAMRSHAVESPSAATSLQTGRPNGCNLCHLDQTLNWTALRLQEWYGTAIPSFVDSQHQQTSAAVLWGIRGDAGQRALVAWALGWDAARRADFDEWRIPHLLNLMEDPYDAVRAVAMRSLRRVIPDLATDFDYAGSLSDRTREVRLLRERFRSVSRAATWEGSSRVLITAEGALDRQRHLDLSRQRDNRPVLLNE